MANRWRKSANSDRFFFPWAPKSLWTGTSATKSRRLPLGRKAITNRDSILKSRDITSLKQVCIVKAMIFLVVMDKCENWIIKKAENQRIDAFELWCWKRLLRVPWTVRRWNQSVLMEINTEYSLEGLMLKFQYFDHLMWRANSLKKPWCWERLKSKEQCGRGWDG